MAAPSLTKEERRALKKAARRLRVDGAAAPTESRLRAKAAAPVPPVAGCAADAANGLERPAKRKRKADELKASAGVADRKERKRKKRADAAAASAAAAAPAPSMATTATSAAACATGDQQPPAKKRKKADKQQPGPAAAAVASVGDVAAARTGLPVLKALYTEHAAVAAMTDEEVAAWRAERATAVAGCDWRPAHEFAHAGAVPVSPARWAGRE